jgi:hypothetical protein
VGTDITNENGEYIPANHYFRIRDGLNVRHSRDHTANEDFADMFASWATGNIDSTDAGNARMAWMTTNMSEWIRAASGQ